MVISHNLLADNSSRQLNIVGKRRAKSTEKLSSGYRVNRSADDAAGLAISEKMRWQIRGLNRASKNIEDGISFVQTGEGALGEIHTMLDRMKELAVQASNDTNTPEDRAQIDLEVQQLKSETQRIFDTTQFNGIFIFRAPYIPNVENEPNDYKLFNIGNSSTLGGVLINSKRYTWDELGVPANGGDMGWTKSFNDTNGELISLKLDPGEDQSKLHRVYEMSANDTGIYINNMLAGEWDSTIVQSGNEYSFEYHGMNLSFVAEDGASRDEIITKLNPDGISAITWDAIPNGGIEEVAVMSSADSRMSINVTNANKNDIERWKYFVSADNEGVTIEQTNFTVADGISHTKTKWSDFSNTDTGEEAYPIVDWGVSNDNPVSGGSVSTNPVTVDNEATYYYTDTTTARQTDPISFSFSFPLDEVSKAQAMAGLTQELTGYSVSAPIDKITTNADNVSARDYSNLTYHFQRDKLKRDFGTDGSDAAMDVTIKRELVSDGSTFAVYEERKVLEAANLKYYKDTDVTTKTYTGEVLVTFDGENETESVLDDSFTLTSSENSGVQTDTAYMAYTNQGKNAIDNTDSVQSDYSIGDEIAGSRVTNEDGTYSYKKTVTYTVTDAHTAEYYEQDGDGNFVIYDNNHNRVDTDEVYAYTVGYDVNDSGLVRSSDGYVYHEATDADTNQHYFSRRTAYTEDKTYHLNRYKYTMYNSDDEKIMSGMSGYFITTRSDSGGDDASRGNYFDDIEDSDADMQADALYAANARASKALPSENILNSLTAFGNLSYGDSGTFNLRTSTVATDLAVRNVTLSASYEGTTSSIRFIYDDRNDAENARDRATTISASITPKGDAVRTFAKDEQSGGNASAQNLKIKMNPPEKLLHIQSGALGHQDIPIRYPALTNSIVGISTIATKSYGQAQAAMASVDDAIDYISGIRAKFGAYQNRLEYAMRIDDYTSENTQAAESRIRDTDMAKESVEQAKQQILEQIGQSVLAQANQSTNGVLQLLR